MAFGSRKHSDSDSAKASSDVDASLNTDVQAGDPDEESEAISETTEETSSVDTVTDDEALGASREDDESEEATSAESRAESKGENRSSVEPETHEHGHVRASRDARRRASERGSFGSGSSHKDKKKHSRRSSKKKADKDGAASSGLAGISRANKRKARKARKQKEKREAKAAEKRASRMNASKNRDDHSKDRHRGNARRNIWCIVATTILVIASIFMFMPPQDRINQGLDIQGGLSVVLTATSTNGGQVSQEDLEQSRSIIESRVNALGASEATVQVQGNDQILVQIPGISDPESALASIGRTGKLEFARVDSFDKSEREKIESGQYMGSQTYTDSYGNTLTSAGKSYMSVKKGTYKPFITGSNITRVTVDRQSDGSSYYAVNITLDSTGAEAFKQASKELVSTHGQIAIILDGQVQSAPAVQSEIDNGQVSITGNYTLQEAKELQTILESGSLPVSFSYAQSQVVGPTLGQGALEYAVIAAIIGLAAIMIYLLVFYRGLGLVTAGALAVFAAFYLGILATLSQFGLFSLSLAGVAGIVLTIGMAADSSVLTLERFREEIRMGRSVRAASITGVRHAILTSIDADLVTLVSALTLFFLATASVKGFGMTLALGIICDIVMMLLFKAPTIRLLAPRVIKRHPKFWDVGDSNRASDVYSRLGEVIGQTASAVESGMMVNTQKMLEIARKRAGEVGEKAFEAAKGLKGKFIRRDINFLGVRKIFLSLSACLIIASFAIFAVRGLNFGIEFVGGTSSTFVNTGSITSQQIQDAYAQAGQSDVTVQTTTANGEEGFIVRTPTTSSQDATTTANEVAKQLGLSTENIQTQTIGPDWGSSVIQSSLIAFAVSLLLIIAYIAIRFEYKMGVTAVIALLHDLVIVMGVYALVGREVTPNTIAALLTILGYSLYDTVVVFHRINDNMQNSEIRTNFMTMANHSVNQVIIRTINTTLTSLVPVLAMLFFGGETLKDFAFAMAVGLISGSYSSIAVATPLFSMWKTHEPRFKKLVKKYGAGIGDFAFADAWDKTSSKAAIAAIEAGEPTPAEKRAEEKREREEAHRKAEKEARKESKKKSKERKKDAKTAKKEARKSGKEAVDAARESKEADRIEAKRARKEARKAARQSGKDVEKILKESKKPRVTSAEEKEDAKPNEDAHESNDSDAQEESK